MTASEQARADALADAETLEWFLFSHDWKAYKALLHVGNLGMESTDRLSGSSPRYAFHAARAAFRAVPGLRGDR